MTNCCEHHAITSGCNQGRACPVRATRDAGACTPEPDDTQSTTDVVVYLALVMMAYTIICGWMGYLWATHGAVIEAFLWALAAKLS